MVTDIPVTGTQIEEMHLMRMPSQQSRIQALLRLTQSPTFYTGMRFGQIGILGLGTIALAEVLSLNQYALYARGSLFSTALSAVFLLGQDQLSLQRRLSLKVLRRRSIAVQAGVGSAVAIVIVSTTPSSIWPVLVSSCIGTGAMVVATSTWVSLQSEGRHQARATTQLVHALTIQAATLVVASLNGSALWATNSGTLLALAWAIGVVLYRGPQVTENAPFREAVGLGIGGASWGLMMAIISIIVAIRSNNQGAAQSRIILLLFLAVVAGATALNGEYFRTKLYGAQRDRMDRRIFSEMWRANCLMGSLTVIAAALAAVGFESLLPAGYRGIGMQIGFLVIAMPAVFISTALFSIEIARGRATISILRNCAFAFIAPITLIVLTPRPSTVVAVLIMTEWSGAIIATLALVGSRQKMHDPSLEQAKYLSARYLRRRAKER